MLRDPATNVGVADIDRSVIGRAEADRPGRSRAALITLGVLAAIVWVGIVRLGVAFWQVSLDWEYVAEQSRVGAPWYYRVAGVWGGMEGSLLLFTGIVGIVAVIAGRRAGEWGLRAAVVTMLTLVGTDLVLASPFGRLDVPATVGFGLNPILEHPAMAIHPPMLYVGLAASGGAALAAIGTVDPWRAARCWLLVSISLLTAAMTLGAAWSYMEQGWGGYWAWDPVENTSMLVWMAALVGVHAAPRTRPAVALACCLAPWVLALLGGALVRSGRTPSVHGFAEQLGVGWTMFVLALATAAGCGLAVARRRQLALRDAKPEDPRRVMVLLMTIAIVIVVVGTIAPVVHDLFGGRATAVRGQFFARTVGPLAVGALPFVLLQLRRRPGRDVRTLGWSTFAHGGIVVLLAGIAMSTADRQRTVNVRPRATMPVTGVDVRNEGVEVGPGPRAGTEAVTATVIVDGREMQPRIVVYPDRGGRLAEVAVHTGLFTDVHVTLRSASDDGSVVVNVHRRHGMWLVWLGALLVTVATLAVTRSRDSPVT